jgi:transcription-repair coupling factor (superfamily II helicase)
MGGLLPYRLDLLATEIDSIRTFDPETQRSLATVKNIHLLPAHEFPLDEATITQFRQNWRSEFSGNPANCTIYNAISQGFGAAGIEYYLPLFFPKMATLIDYLPKSTQLLQIGPITTAIEKYWQEVEGRYELYRYDITRPLLAPLHWLNSLDEFNTLIAPFPRIALELKKN